MRNLRDLKEYVLRESGMDLPEFLQKSEKHRKFWERISKLWDPEKVRPEDVDDVDVATEVSDHTWNNMMVIFGGLLRI